MTGWGLDKAREFSKLSSSKQGRKRRGFCHAMSYSRRKTLQFESPTTQVTMGLGFRVLAQLPFKEP